jgi:RNA polymerase sigma-70 factor, ECF subfamily
MEKKMMIVRTPRPHHIELTTSGPRPELRLPDEEVIARVLLGETSLYGGLVQRHNTRLYKILWRILYSHEAVEDVMQEAHSRAFTRLHQFEGRSRFITWLTKIMINEAYAHLRRRRLFQPLDGDSANGTKRPVQFACGARNPEQKVIQEELRQILEAAVDSLPEPYRVVFAVREIGEASTAEAAAHLGITEQCVKSRMLRARLMLQKKIASVAPAGS